MGGLGGGGQSCTRTVKPRLMMVFTTGKIKQLNDSGVLYGNGVDI